MRKRSGSVGDDGTGADADRQFITALHRGLEVLRAFRPDDRAGLSNRDLALRTGLPNSTVSRLTYTLLKSDYLLYDRDTGRYRIGLPVLSLGAACLSGLPLREAAQGHMQALAEDCGEGVQVALGGRVDLTMIYLAAARSPGVIALQLGVGSRISLARSAMGRAWLAACDPAEREVLLDELEHNAGHDAWPRLRDGIQLAAEQIAERGFYANIGEWQPGVNSVAVPFRSGPGAMPLLAFNLGGSSAYLPQDRLEGSFGPKLVRLVAKLAQGAF
jgi:DNA-binding IclR family transcriptional regulator